MEIDLFAQVCSYENLFLAYEKARKRKTLKNYVLDFEKDLKENLLKLHSELISKEYRPRPLKTFIIRDPKTRKISKSNFRDRIIHHALCNIIEPIFDKNFIYDNYANRKGKGVLKAVERFDHFKRKVSKNNTCICYVLKADIKHYFENVNHNVLFSILSMEIQDENILWLIETILSAPFGGGAKEKIGMPLGNLTSQFFANVYLNKLDQFVKHRLKAKYYLRYVDDFIILSRDKKELEIYKEKINSFLSESLHIELHPDKSKIKVLNKGINFLGFKIFYHHKLLRKKNMQKFERTLLELKSRYQNELIEREKVLEIFEGWLAYSFHADTYKYRRHITRQLNTFFPITRNTDIKNIKKEERFARKIVVTNYDFSSQKTLQQFRKKLTITQIAQIRNIKKGTVWDHLAKLIEYGQLNVWKVIPGKKIIFISKNIYNQEDKLKEIKARIDDPTITFNEINCVLASIKQKNKERSILYNIKEYQRLHCSRKCYFEPGQRTICVRKLAKVSAQCGEMKMKRKEFLDLFNNHLNICVLPEKEKRSFISYNEFIEKIRNNLVLEIKE